MIPNLVRLAYEVLSRVGLNPALKAAQVPDVRLVELVEGRDRLTPSRALDLGCGAGRNSIYLAGQGWDVTGVDLVGRAIATARSRAAAGGTQVHFVQGDVTHLERLDIGDGYTLIVDSGCYYTLSAEQRDAFVAGVTAVAHPEALLLMSGFTKLPGTRAGIGAEDLQRRFSGWEVRASALVPIEEILRHTAVPRPLKAGLRSGRLEIRRFELSRVP